MKSIFIDDVTKISKVKSMTTFVGVCFSVHELWKSWLMMLDMVCGECAVRYPDSDFDDYLSES